MALRRFYLEPENIKDDLVRIDGELYHHIRDVVRFGVGDRFEVLVGDGSARLVEILAVDKRLISAKVVGVRDLPPLKKPWITLALSVPKLPKVDWIVEKCVELGIYQIRPFVSDFSFLRKVNEVSPSRMERWQKLILAATQQSGRGERLKLGEPTTLKNLLEEFNRAPLTGGLFPYEGEAQVGLKTALREVKGKELEHLWVFVGSEGGFSADEVKLFAQYGLNPVTMGEQILRVETACLALASIIKYELEE